ncbi:MAG: asparagine synthase (glutamine-hydrolyzing) [Bacillota bacterium]
MCGITGWIDWEVDLTGQRPVLEAMAAPLALRGPDAHGVWLSPRCGFGHRRLTVVDPEGGGQPMIRQVGDRLYVICYNGELYNTADLRAELEARGHRFRSHSDTEVLLVSYIEWGPSCVERLNGIFAFGIWDESEQRLFMARDRLGVKPLFYTTRGSAFLFGSELKALLAHPEVEPAVDAEGLAEIFYLGPSRTPGHGVYRGIQELRPGRWLIHDRQGTRVQTYWRLESRPHEDDLQTTAERVRWLLRDSIHRQLVADVPVATLLSGGLDSSAITAFAAEAFQDGGLGQLHTWSIDYRDNEKYFQSHAFQPDPDAPFARLMSEHLGTVHHNVLVDTPQLVESLITATVARDLPGMADVDSSLYLFCKAIKKEATVVLSGECADEIFGGYPWFHKEEALGAGTFPWVRMLPERVRLLKPGLTGPIRAEEYVAQRYADSIAEVPQLPGEEPLEARRRAMFYLNMTWFMATLLDRKDRMSMAASLEARVPFCDHRLVEYVWNIPWAMKTYGGREKGILRLALQGILPEEVRERRKSPYPKTHNPNYYKAVRDWVLQILADPNARLHEVVDAEAVRQLARQEQTATGLPWFGQLMGGAQYFAYLGQVETWLRRYKVRLV